MLKFNYLWSILLLVTIFSCKQQEDLSESENNLINQVPAGAITALESADDLDILLNDIGDARYVLLGEASHGTAEYYSWRAEISRRLIQEKGFTIIAVEGDWPDMYRLNQYIKGSNAYGSSAAAVLRQQERWPTWMWANEEVAALGEWLRNYNQNQPADEQLGFYGLDVYSLWDSLEEVIAYLDTRDPAAAQQAREALACFAPYNEDEWAYAQAAATNNENSCADELAALLARVQQEVSASAGNEAQLNLQQNTLVAVNAERYYTTALQNDAASWNIRDRHMTETINNLIDYHGSSAKIIVWEHNTHVGDARATDMASAGMVNVGQLVREQHSEEEVYIVGFGSYQGTVLAAPRWGAAVQTMQVPAARANSWEAIMHSMAPSDKILLLEELRENSAFMSERGHRAIGVVYNPEQEQGNYVPSILPERYDAFLFIDRTTAVEPL
ncbi:erythromycin esterase family protein [Cesiribacter sp. SM1]|uniref:erythromycin esterase family protein n=1 Tax=Cesiribacter sp. SM1 TaxID=2861196 RepID=UPI001CD5BFA4|nr:erythromycin esterase family protein [Cesiribacter sp. SM1]